SQWSSSYLPLLLLALSSSDITAQYGPVHGIRSIPVPSNWCGDASHSLNHCHRYHSSSGLLLLIAFPALHGLSSS
ncbi:hypothetical protein BDD12DRAFT_813324, partial [Trichophaea hybrida]